MIDIGVFVEVLYQNMAVPKYLHVTKMIGIIILINTNCQFVVHTEKVCCLQFHKHQQFGVQWLTSIIAVGWLEFQHWSLLKLPSSKHHY